MAKATLTPYTGKHSEAGKRGPGPEKGQIDAYKGKGSGAPASAVGGSLSRKGKHELTPYGGK